MLTPGPGSAKWHSARNLDWTRATGTSAIYNVLVLFVATEPAYKFKTVENSFSSNGFKVASHGIPNDTKPGLVKSLRFVFYTTSTVLIEAIPILMSYVVICCMY